MLRLFSKMVISMSTTLLQERNEMSSWACLIVWNFKSRSYCKPRSHFIIFNMGVKPSSKASSGIQLGFSMRKLYIQFNLP